jgi:hypothetical protein
VPEPIVLWRWWIVDERTGKRRLTKWHMTEQDALELLSRRGARAVEPKEATQARQRSRVVTKELD